MKKTRSLSNLPGLCAFLLLISEQQKGGKAYQPLKLKHYIKTHSFVDGKAAEFDVAKFFWLLKEIC